jgi:uncharacterized protein (TIGR02246 family)
MRHRLEPFKIRALFVLSILITPTAILGSGKSASNQDVDLSDPDVAAIVQIAKDFSEAYRAGDAERIASFYSPNLIYMSQGMPNHEGKEVIEQLYKDLFSKYRGTVAVHIDEVKVSGDMAFDRATFTVTLTPKDGGKASETKGRLLEVLRKENGKWKSLRVITNTE